MSEPDHADEFPMEIKDTEKIFLQRKFIKMNLTPDILLRILVAIATRL